MCYVEAGCIGGRLVRGFVVVVVVGSRRQLDTLDQYQCAGSEGQIDAEGGCRRKGIPYEAGGGGSKGGTGKQSEVGEGRGERRIKRVGDKKQRAGEETSLASKGSQADPD